MKNCTRHVHFFAGIFLDEDNQTNLTITALQSGVNRINMYSKSSKYVIKPHIYVLRRGDVFKAGQLGKQKSIIQFNWENY